MTNECKRPLYFSNLFLQSPFSFFRFSRIINLTDREKKSKKAKKKKSDIRREVCFYSKQTSLLIFTVNSKVKQRSIKISVL